MTTTVTAKIQIRKGTAVAWTSANPILLSGEIGYETDTKKLKFGDGTTAWISLAYYHDPELGGTYEPADATILKQADVDDTPVNGVTTAPVSSNWAFDHAALVTAHGISTFGASLVDDADVGTARSTLGLGTAATTAATDYATSSHAHGNLTNAGAIGSTANLPVITSTSGVLAAGAFGTGATNFCVGNDARLSDARTPSAHSHEGTAILSTGEAGGTKFLREDGDGTCSWQSASGGVASDTHAATEKVTPVDADEVPLVDSAASFVLKRLTWANIKTTLSGVFALLAGKAGGQTLIGGTAVGDALSLQGTSGNGTVTGTALAVKVGNNGALTALTVANNGQLTIQGNATTDLPVYGAELLTSAGWTVNAGWTESPDDTFAHTSGTDTLTHSATITSGHKYQISWTVTGRTAGSFTVAVGGQSQANNIATGALGPTAGSTAAFTITPTTDFNGTVSLVSLKRMTAVSTPNRVMKNSAGVVIGEERGNSTGTFIGIGAGGYNTTGVNNSFVGVNAGLNNTTGSSNSFIGQGAGYSNTTGVQNSFVGVLAGYSNTTGLNNIFMGMNAGYSNTTGSQNSFVGVLAGYSNTTGSSNSFVGMFAGYKNTTGYQNIFVGQGAGYSNTTGFQNNFMGVNAGYSNTTGAYNSFMGHSSGSSNTTGYSNVFNGVNAGISNTTGYSNICIGVQSGDFNTTGNLNVFVGVRTGRYHADGATPLTDPEYSIYIGFNACGKDNSDNNSVVIGGNTPIGLGANTTVIGTSATTITRLYGDLGMGTDTPSAKGHFLKTTEQLRLGYDASNYASFTVDSAGNLTLANTGTSPSTYIATLRSGMKVTAVTTTASPAATDAGTLFSNEGDVDGATITLPTAAAGLNFIAYVQAAQTLTITAGAGDTIRIASSVTAAAGSITSNVVGSSVTLVAINNVEWIATASIGSWSF